MRARCALTRRLACSRQRADQVPARVGVPRRRGWRQQDVSSASQTTPCEYSSASFAHRAECVTVTPCCCAVGEMAEQARCTSQRGHTRPCAPRGTAGDQTYSLCAHVFIGKLYSGGARRSALRQRRRRPGGPRAALLCTRLAAEYRRLRPGERQASNNRVSPAASQAQRAPGWLQPHLRNNPTHSVSSTSMSSMSAAGGPGDVLLFAKLTVDAAVAALSANA